MSPSPALDHVLRPVPPWRTNDLTECGLSAVDHRTITRDEFQARLKAQGQQRLAMTVCMTCWSTARRWKSWEASPGDVIRRDVYGLHGSDGIDEEFRAIAALIAAHQDEFHGYLTGLAATVSLDQARRTRATRNRDSYNREGL